MSRRKGVKAKVDVHPRYGVPQRFHDVQAPPSKAKPAEIAAGFLKQVASELKIKPDLSQLKFDKVKKSVLGRHVLYQQYHDGKAVSGAWVRVDIDHEGRVYNVQNDLVPEPALAKTRQAEARRVSMRGARRAAAAQLSPDDAKARAVETVAPGRGEALEAESCFVPHDGVPRAAWKVVVVRRRPRGEWKVYLDAYTGEVLESRSLLKYATARGRVFDPNPVVRLNDTALTDTSPLPTSAYTLVDLPDVDGTGVLDGPFVTTRTTANRIKRTSGKFLFKRKQRAFKEVMVYFHIDRAQRHIQSLGFDNVLAHPIAVNVDGIPDDNSFYSPVTKSLTFGTGGVDDAEDADIILHEYGHAIQDDQVPGFGASHEGGSMGEGFGDFLAASFFADVKAQRLRPAVGSWDAVAYSGDDPPCLRRVDSNKKYPKDLRGEVHDDGEIWSACLWEIRQALGRHTAEKLVIAHHFLLTRTATFESAAQALITADRNLNGGQNETALRDVFIRRGILPNPKRANRRAGEPFGAVAGGARRRAK
jgi:Zn-dependent metalloprotease